MLRSSDGLNQERADSWLTMDQQWCVLEKQKMAWSSAEVVVLTALPAAETSADCQCMAEHLLQQGHIHHQAVRVCWRPICLLVMLLAMSSVPLVFGFLVPRFVLHVVLKATLT